jgi:D-glycero-D-manno-heptose 1,7-bisphosphate phosphatase
MSLHAHDRVRGVLFDRDDMVQDARSGSDPWSAQPVDGARRAVHALQHAGLRVGVVADPIRPTASGSAVAARLEQLVGPFDVWCTCATPTAEGRTAAVRSAAERWGIDPAEIVVIGGVGADVGAARETGAASILVADAASTSGEIEQADVVVGTILDAAALVLRWYPASSSG